MKNKIKNKGFTLLLSILVVSVILSVGLGIFDIMTKELKLSGIGRESQIAFYAADAGIECFFYWEIKHPGLADTAFDSANTINCAGNSVANNFSGNISNFTLPLSNNSCVKIKVTKSGLTTTVESRGYNTACDSTSSFKVERAIQMVSTKNQGSVAGAPGVPDNVQAQVVSQRQINLSWDAASGAANYLIYRGADANNLSEIGVTTATSYNNTGLTDNTTYYYQVVASNSYGYTAESAVASATTQSYSSACASDGGDWVSSQNTCYFSGTSCKSGWSPNQSYSTTVVSKCSGSGNCQTTSCSTGSHNRSNSGLESCIYFSAGAEGTAGFCYWVQCTTSIIEIGCKKN